MNWTIGKIIGQYDEKDYFNVLNTETNEITKTLITSRAYKPDQIPKTDLLFAYTGHNFPEKKVFVITKIISFDENFINIHFNDLRFDVMSYIDKFHPQLINEKFQKLVYEKEKLIRELKDNLKINDIIVEPSEIV